MRAAVLTISTSLSNGEGEDRSGPELVRLCEEAGLEVEHETVADDREAIKLALIRWADQDDVRFVFTTGGTLKKGDALAVARIAGIMAAKKTSELIPLCHPIALNKVEVEITAAGSEITITATAETNDRTGVEMEAMTAAAVAALTVYDMVKGIERGVEIAEVALLEKTGGRSGHWRRDGA